jgi:predicted lipid carrier protein YhbT
MSLNQELVDRLCVGFETAVRRLPPPPVPAVACAINHVLRGQPARSRLEELEGKVVAIVIEDAGLTVPLGFRNGRVEPAPGRAPNVTLRGKLAAFRVLALRREDPDALFFDRRLAIEGETETGLLVKNFLDAFEFDLEAHVSDVLPRPLARPLIAALAGAAHARRVYSRMAPVSRSMPAEPPRYPSQ